MTLDRALSRRAPPRLLLLLAVFGSAPGPSVSHAAEAAAQFEPPRLHDIEHSPYQSRQIITLGARTLMIIGKPNNLRTSEPDVGNIVLHREGDTLYMVDSGALEAYRPVILEAARRLGPVKIVFLINTHGHTDHIANNDLLWQIPAGHHYLLMPRLAMDHARHEAEYYAWGTGRIAQFARIIPDWVHPEDSSVPYWKKELDTFTPWRPVPEKAIPLEQFPLQQLAIAGTRQLGWKITEDLYVLPTRGHTDDSVIVYFPHAKLMCLGDETNRAYHIFLDADGVHSLALFQRLLDMLDAGAIDKIVDSHHFFIFGTGQARAWLNGFLKDEEYEQALFLRVLRSAGEKGLRLDELIGQLSNDPWWRTRYLPTKETFPIAIPMAILKRVRDMGIDEIGTPPESRFRLRLEAADLLP